MTAYELADDIKQSNMQNLGNAANMLRQQADRIAELEKQGEPVAWMEYIQDEEWEVWYTEPTDLPEGHSYKPLYLAPQIKPLSDEEIIAIRDSCYVQSGIDEWEFDDVNFARAIEERHGIK